MEAKAELQPLRVIGPGDHDLNRPGGPHHHVAGLRREADRELLQVGLRIQQGGVGEIGKAPVEQPLALGELLALDIAPAVRGVLGPQNHGDQCVPLFLDRGHQAVARLSGAAGFDADGAVHGVAVMLGGGQQTVGVEQTAGLGQVGGGDGIAAGGDDLPERRVGHGLLGHAVDVPGCGVVVGVVQAMGIDKVGARHPQLLGTLVHQLHKRGDISTDGHGQYIGRLIGGGQQQAVK